MKKIIKIKGMHCNSCSRLIEDAISPMDGILSVEASYSKEQVEVDFNPEKVSEEKIKEKIKGAGYEVNSGLIDEKSNVSKKPIMTSNNVGWAVVIASLIIVVFMIYHFFLSNLNLQVPGVGESSSLILLFFVGILTGFHCISMCGGFVVSYTTKNAIKGHSGYKQHLVYGGSKVISYAIIGGLFGLIGGIVAFNLQLRAGVSIFAGLFMIFYSLSMLGFKFFRKFQFNPKFITHLSIKAGKHAKGPYKGPFVTGILSGLFIACGPLQAMYLYAAGTGSFFQGASGLALFGLGTIPIMIGFGSLTSVISKTATKRILKVSAIIVLILGLIMINRGLTVMGSSFTYDTIKQKVTGVESANSIISGDSQVIKMEVNRYGWTPDSFVLQKDIPVRWEIDVKELTGCNNEIIVPDYDLGFKLKQGLNVIEFTPDKVGTVRWSCWMGMIPGTFIVTEDGSASETQIEQAAPGPSGSCGGSCGSPTCGGTTGGGCGCGG